VAIKWKIGKPQIKIRKAGIINMVRMIEFEVISESQLLECFCEVLPQIKSCISDDWAPELRLSCC
jgi:dynein assembly factor 5